MLYGYKVLPVNERKLQYYVGWRYISSKVVAGSIKNELYGIRSYLLSKNIVINVDKEHMPILHRIYRGYKKLRPNGTRVSVPINNDILFKMFSVINDSVFDGLVIKALLLFAKFGLARVSEYTQSEDYSAKLNSLTFVPDLFNPGVLIYTFHKSKTNQFHRKERIVIACTCSRGLCALHAMSEMCLKRQHLNSVNENIGSNDDLFVFENGYSVKTGDVNVIIKKVCAKAGLDPSLFSSHKLRSGGTKDYLAWGVSELLVQELGRWSNLDMVSRYNQLSATDIVEVLSDSL